MRRDTKFPSLEIEARTVFQRHRDTASGGIPPLATIDVTESFDQGESLTESAKWQSFQPAPPIQQTQRNVPRSAETRLKEHTSIRVKELIVQQTMQSMEPFDLHRMFLGDHSDFLFFLEIAFRTLAMYLYTLFFARLVGKRAVGQISPFEFILVIAISSAAGDPMFYLHVPLLHGMTVMTVVILLHRAVGLATVKSEKAENLIESDPLLVVSEGKIVEKAVGAGTISRKELLMNLRVQGVRDVGEVDKAFFEPSGQLSVFRASPDQEKETESTQPRETQTV